MSSVADICNMALSHLGVSTEIQNLETEKSKEAQACRRFYEPTRDEVLRDFAWPFATVIESLALVASEPNTDWGYAYRYPADALTVRSLWSGYSRKETQTTRIPYRISRDATGKLIYTDQVAANAVVEYTMKETDTERYPPDFVDALSLLLAAKIGPRVAGGDQFSLADRAFKMYWMRISEARANALNEEGQDQAPESQFITARD